MGAFLSNSMEDNLKQNQDFITEMNTIKIERQLQMQKLMREREVALKIANYRELFYWLGAFYITSFSMAYCSYKRRKRPIFMLPLMPLTFLMAYQTDLAYGTKTLRIINEAENILKFEPELVQLPIGVPSASALDIGRAKCDENKKLHSYYC